MYSREQIPLPFHIRRSVPKRQAEYFHGRRAARACLRDLGFTNEFIPTGAHREPVWPSGICGSITHSEGICAAVAVSNSDVSGIGLDVEALSPTLLQESIQTSIFNPSEIAVVRGAAGYWPLLEKEPPAQRGCRQCGHAPHLLDARNTPEGSESGRIRTIGAFSAALSAKESFFKAAFPEVGCYFDFDAVALVDMDVRCGLVRFRIRRHLSPTLTVGRVVGAQVGTIAPGYVLSSCLLMRV
jgi:4'-phosphopantetheinyl transferase EntD